MRTARARRSPGTSSTSSSRKAGPGQADGLPRDHQGRDPRRRRQPARDRHGPRRGPGGAPHPRPPLRLRGLARCCGRRSCPASPPAACSRSRPGWSSTGSASGCASASRPTGTSRAPSTPAPSTTRGCSRPSCTPSTRSASPAAPTSTRTACSRRAPSVVHLDRARAEALAAGLQDTTFDVRSVESKPYRRSPYAPFRTTTLQQEASRKLGMSASVTMSVAQRLYENGFITYMRTDSTTLSGGAVDAARSQVRELYGAEYLPDSPRIYASKVKNAQEAHEAIRPAGESFRTPAQTGLTGEQFRLYELIWMRTVASQMKDAVGNTVTIRLGGAADERRGRRLLRQRPHDHLPRLPQGLRRGHRRGRREGRRRDPAAEPRARATPSRPRASTPPATRPSRRRATPRRR